MGKLVREIQRLKPTQRGICYARGRRCARPPCSGFPQWYVFALPDLLVVLGNHERWADIEQVPVGGWENVPMTLRPARVRRSAEEPPPSSRLVIKAFQYWILRNRYSCLFWFYSSTEPLGRVSAPSRWELRCSSESHGQLLRLWWVLN